MNPTGKWSYVAIVVAVALFATGCGGGGDKKSSDNGQGSSTSTASKAEFITAADNICKAENEKIGAEGQAALNSNDSAAVEQFVTDTLLPDLRDEIAQLRALPRPSADDATIESFYDEVDAGLNQIEQDPKVLLDTTKANEVFAQANQDAQDYGLKVCGNPSGG